MHSVHRTSGSEDSNSKLPDFWQFFKVFFRDLLYIVVDCGDQRKGVGKSLIFEVKCQRWCMMGGWLGMGGGR